MATYRVTETQHIRYTWEVEAESVGDAESSAICGVPDDAREKFSSEVEAELLP